MSINEILNQTETIAVIGCSSRPFRTSHQISEYLLSEGFNIIPVNPNEESVLGQKAYPTMSHLPDDFSVELVVIFRNRRYTKKMIKEIVDWADTMGQKPVIWTQLNVSTPEAKKLAEKHGLIYVENRCVMVEHQRVKI